MPNDLAVVVMAYNEAEVLDRCLASVAGLELHVSVDSATTDESLQVAERHGAKLYWHKGLPGEAPESDYDDAAQALDSYSRMRNDVLTDVCEQTRAPWFLWLDADEVVTAGMDGLLEVLPQILPQYAALAVQMKLFTGAVCDSVMRNSKVIRRHVRFTRRRHEHIDLATGEEQALCNDLVIEHHPTQPAQVRAEHDKRKRSYPPFIRDWKQFRDGRAAFYLGDWWTHQCPETALLWYQKGLDLPDTACIPMQRAQLAVYAGRLYMHMGLPVEAKRSYHRALEIDGGYGEAAYYLGLIALGENKLEEAKLWFGMAAQYPDEPLTIMQQETGCTCDMPHLGLAAVAIEQGDRAEAYRQLNVAERKAPFIRQQLHQLRAKLDEM